MMELTRITKENLEYFRLYLPPGHATPEQEALGLIADDGVPCAAALISGAEGQAAIDWLYVHPEYRRKGAGSTLLEKTENLLAVETDSLSISYPAEIPGMDELLDANGYLITEGDPIYAISLAELKDSPEVKTLKKMGEKGEACPISSLGEEEKESLLDFLEDELGPEANFLKCDAKLSMTLLDEKRRVISCILIQRMEDQETLFVSLLASRGSGQATAVLGKALQLVDSDPALQDYTIRFISNNEHIDRFVENLTADLPPADISYIRYAVKAL